MGFLPPTVGIPAGEVYHMVRRFFRPSFFFFHKPNPGCFTHFFVNSGTVPSVALERFRNMVFPGDTICNLGLGLKWMDSMSSCFLVKHYHKKPDWLCHYLHVVGTYCTMSVPT